MMAKRIIPFRTGPISNFSSDAPFRAAPSRRSFIALCAALISCLLLTLPHNAEGCTDLLTAFLSVEKMNETVKNALMEINVTFQKLDVAISQQNQPEAKAAVSKLVEKYFDFYFKYYQDPPAQFVDDPKWHDKLSEVNRRLKLVLGYVNDGKLEEAHENVKTAYESFSAIYKDRVPMQEQNVLDMITAKIATMNEAMDVFMGGGTSEVSVHANNLKGLAERLAAFDSSNEAYLAERKAFTDLLYERSVYFVKNPISSSSECLVQRKELDALKGTVESFIVKRKGLLNKEWFEGGK